MLEFTLGGGAADPAEVFVGVGAVVDVDAGTIDTSDAIGLDADVDELTLVIVTTGGGSPVEYTGLSITGLDAELVGIDDLVAKATGVDVQVNMAADPAVVAPASAQLLDWANYTPATDELDLPTLGGLTDAVSLHADGQITIDLFGFVAIDAGFELSKYETSGTDGTVTLTDASVLEFTLGGGAADPAEVFVGVGAVVDVDAGTIDTSDAIGLDADVDELTLVIVTTGGSSPVEYTGLSITGLDAELVGIDDLVAKATGVNVQVDMAADPAVVAPASAQLLDWANYTPATDELDLPTLGGLTDAVSLHADGQITIDLFGFVAIDAGFELSKYETSGTDGTVTLTDASVLEFTLGGGAADPAEVFVGVGAVVDVDAGTIDTSDAIGLDADVDELTLVIVTTGGSSPVEYTGLSITGLDAELVGIDDLVAKATGVNVQVNMAADPAVVAPASAQLLDWANYTPATDELDLPTLGGLTDAVSLHADGQITIDLFGFVAIDAGFELSKYETSGTDGTVTLTDGSVLEFTLGGGAADPAEVFVGVGAVVDVDAGTIDTSDAIGLDADVDELTLVIVTTGGSSPVEYTGLSITGLDAELVGIDDLVAKATGVNVQVNMAADPAVVAPASAQLLDWANYTPATDELDLPTLGGLTDAVSLHADGQITIDLFGFVAIDAGFELSKYETSGTDGTVTLTDASVLEFTLGGGAADPAEVFVGVGAVVDVDAGTIDTSDAIGLDADVDELTLVIVTTGGSSPVEYTGLSITGLDAELVGIDDLVAKATGVNVQVDMAADPAVVAPASARCSTGPTTRRPPTSSICPPWAA